MEPSLTESILRMAGYGLRRRAGIGGGYIPLPLQLQKPNQWRLASTDAASHAKADSSSSSSVSESLTPPQTFTDATADALRATSNTTLTSKEESSSSNAPSSSSFSSSSSSSTSSSTRTPTRNDPTLFPLRSQASATARALTGSPLHTSQEPALRLPSTFGRNQSLQVPDERRKMLEKIVGNFSAVRWAIAYGSGIFEQSGYEMQKKEPMLDFVFATSHPSHFHAVNLNRHPSHYPLLARWLGVDYITRIQHTGAGVWYATMIDIEGRKIKYGVISVDDLCEDLMDWKTLYIGGRMMKPVRMVRRDQRVLLANQVNLVSALRVALLTLPEEFTERELWEKVAGISYSGDPRMSLGGENPNKVSNIVVPQIPRFRELYFKLLDAVGGVKGKEMQEQGKGKGKGKEDQDWSADEKIWRGMGMGEEGGKGVMIQTNTPEYRSSLLRRLPRTLRTALENRYSASLNLTIAKPGDTKEDEASEQKVEEKEGVVSEDDFWLRVAGEGDLRKAIEQEVRNIVRPPAITQTFKGLFTAGFRKSLTYASKKVGKWWQGQPKGSKKLNG